MLADVAFLIVDLQRLGHSELAVAFLRDYCEFSDEHHPGSLAGRRLVTIQPAGGLAANGG